MKQEETSTIDVLLDRLEKLSPVYSKCKDLFGLDKRSIALWRVTMSIVILGDIWNRMSNLYAHYTDNGILPRTKALDYFWNYYWFCFHMWSGAELWQWLLFVLHALFTFGMLIGYRTKFCRYSIL